MNSKRQTIWLVSMLGLMVILSAYYLFTDEAEQIPVTTEQASGDEIIVEGVGMMDPTAGGLPAVDLDSIALAENDEPTSETDVDETIADHEGAVVEEMVTDEEVLKRLANQSGADALTAMQIERESMFSKRIEELTAALSNEAATETEIAEAINKQNELMDIEAKLIAFEEKMLSDYENVAVTYDESSNHYTINVSAAQLEKSEAASIVSEALNDLDIALHQVTVKLYKN